jgi:hypothetical protein
MSIGTRRSFIGKKANRPPVSCMTRSIELLMFRVAAAEPVLIWYTPPIDTRGSITIRSDFAVQLPFGFSSVLRNGQGHWHGTQAFDFSS